MQMRRYQKCEYPINSLDLKVLNSFMRSNNKQKFMREREREKARGYFNN